MATHAPRYASVTGMLLTTRVGLKPRPRRYRRVGFYCPRMQTKSPQPPMWRCRNDACDRTQGKPRDTLQGCSFIGECPQMCRLSFARESAPGQDFGSHRSALTAARADEAVE